MCSDEETSLADLMKAKPMYVTPNGRKYEFYLSGEITEADNYVDWFNQIRNTNENDLIVININSSGGSLFTAIQLMSVLEDSNAKKLINVEGACMSAATLILLCGDAYSISPFALFMFHDYSGGVVGKGGEMKNQIDSQRKWSECIYRDVYEDFLTNEEIEGILKGTDLWLHSDDVMKRLNSKIQKHNDMFEQHEKEQAKMSKMFEKFMESEIEKELSSTKKQKPKIKNEVKNETKVETKEVDAKTIKTNNNKRGEKKNDKDN